MKLRLSSILAVLTLVFLFGFPKAGFYVGNIPITIGYLLLALMAFTETVRLAIDRKRGVEARYLWLGLLIFSLAVVETVAFCVHGSKSPGAMISILVSTIGMPILAILGTHCLLRVLGLETTLTVLRWALVPVLAFGLLAFVIYNATGTIIGIPFLTTTGSDVTLVVSRHNLRGPFIKMFSTYNNGNILGINLLLWGPIAALASTRCTVGFRSLCVLTLSRSVWAGMITLEMLGAMVDRSLGRVLRASCGAILLVIAVVIASWMIGKNPMQFLLDKDLGGRVTNLQDDLEVISATRIGWDSESLYAAAWLAFGPVGLTLIVAVWLTPIVSGGNTEIQKVARLALIVYLLIASVEGAFTLVPTQAVYWFVAAIAMCSRQTLQIHNEVCSESETVFVASTEAMHASY